MKLFEPYRSVQGPEILYEERKALHRGYPVDTCAGLEGGDVFISVFEGDEIIVQCICSRKGG